MWELIGWTNFTPSTSSSQTWIKLCLLSFLIASFVEISQTISSIDHLEGEAGFRMASLQWKYFPHEKAPVSFRVRYCELHTWGLHRCRYQVVETNSSRSGRHEKGTSTDANNVSIEIGGLRMATNYSFQVVPQDPGLKAGHPSQIALQTKGFSAKASKCLADSSEVSVETGPFFAGQISVDESEIPGCFIKGNPQSPQTQYILRIRHEECGSQINESRVSTIILVQENLPILTHSTRKFVVVCSFSPESFVVKTGVTLPRETSVAKGIDFSGIIRLSPQGTNLLIADKDHQSPRRSTKRDPSRLFSTPLPIAILDESDFQNANSITSDLEHDTSLESTPNPLIPLLNPQESRRQSRAYQSHSSDMETTSLGHEKGGPSASAAVQGQGPGGHGGKLGGGWEGFLVLGLVSLGIMASVLSLLWFVKSYRTTPTSPGDDLSESSSVTTEDGPPSISSMDNACSFTNEMTRAGRLPKNLDTRSELEVELDFEFSEEKNTSMILKNNAIKTMQNPSNFHLQLDKTRTNPIVSHS